jgi:quercetin dioxygenase-like cupin family protein
MRKASNRGEAGRGGPRPAAPARSTLFQDGGATLSLCFYPPGLRQDWHAHDEPSLALLLSGSVREQSGREDEVARSGSVGLKPEDLRHRNQYGPDGAILLSLTVHDPALWARRPGRDGWSRPGSAARAQALAAAALGERLDPGDLAVELLSLKLEDWPAQSEPPPWFISAEASAAGTGRASACSDCAARPRSRFEAPSTKALRPPRRPRRADSPTRAISPGR